MLSFFRRGGIAQLFVGAIVVAIIVVFIMTGTSGPSGSMSGTQCALEVGSRCVTTKEYWAAYGLTVHPSLTAKEIKRLDLRRQVMEALTERELLLEEAERLGIEVGEDDINSELRKGRMHVSLPADNGDYLGASLALCPPSRMGGCEPGTDYVRMLPVEKNGEFDIDLYNRMVRSTTNRSPKEFKAMQQRELIAARMRDLVRSRVRIPEDEAYLLYERDRSRATIRFVQLNRDWFGRYVANVTPDAVDDWMVDNKEAVDKAWSDAKDQFKAGCPLAREIALYFAPGATDEEKAAQRKELEDLKKRAQAGEDFTTLAREASDAESALVGGQIGCLTEGYGVGASELLKALGRTAAGKLSEIVETARGFTLLKHEGKLEEAKVEAVGRRLQAQELAARAMAEELAKDFATALIEKVKDGASLEDATTELARQYAERGNLRAKGAKADEWPALSDAAQPKVEISAPFNAMQSPIRSALPSEQAAVKAFELKKADEVYDKPIQTAQGFAVMQMKELDPAKREDFEKDKVDILRSLREAKSRQALESYLERLRSTKSAEIKFNSQLLGDEESEEPAES